MFSWIRNLFSDFKPGEHGENAFFDLQAVRILEKSDLDGLKQLFAGIQDDWPRRYFHALAMSRSFPESRLEQWVNSEPDSADAHLVLGARALKLAWDLRGYGLASGVSDESRDKFFAKLDQTEELLLRAARLNPFDPTPWALLVMVAVYRSDGDAAEQDYLDEAVSRDPHNWHAHIHRLTGLGEKYGGSHEAMFDFARVVRIGLPERHLLHGLVLKAHSEYWKYLQYYAEDTEGAEAHRTDPEVIAECLEAWRQALDGVDLDDPDALFVSINAAGTMWILRQREPLRELLLQLDGRISDVHWRWVGTEGELEQARRFAFGEDQPLN